MSGEGVGDTGEVVRAEDGASRRGAGEVGLEQPIAKLVTARPETRNAWLWIWIRPRGVVRAKIDRGPTGWMWLIPVLAGFGNTLDRASKRSAGDENSIPLVVLTCAGAAIVLGIPVLALVAWVLGALGRAFGGRGTSRDVRIALCWGAIPGVLELAVWASLWAVIGNDAFRSEPQGDPLPDWLITLVLYLMPINILIRIWSAFIAVKALSEAHRFSAWRGLLVYLVAVILFLVIVLVFVVPGLTAR